VSFITEIYSVCGHFVDTSKLNAINKVENLCLVTMLLLLNAFDTLLKSTRDDRIVDTGCNGSYVVDKIIQGCVCSCFK
jgi:hypothetical protein